MSLVRFLTDTSLHHAEREACMLQAEHPDRDVKLLSLTGGESDEMIAVFSRSLLVVGGEGESAWKSTTAG